MSLASLLPAPKNSFEDAFGGNKYAGKALGQAPKPQLMQVVPTGTAHRVPKYRERGGFMPRAVEDFGDGGAFPECHALQYPLNMGRKDGVSSKVAMLATDEKGDIKYDMLVRQNARKDTTMFSNYKDLLPKEFADEDLQKPSAEEELKLAEKTRKALGLLVDAKLSAAQPTHIKKQGNADPIFIRYTPSQQAAEFNSGATQRIIKLQEMPVDPLEPPKFQHKKVPGGPPSPPPPVMHSPPRKITVQDQQNWKIPPCVSNWKNINGFTIPLDKRLAADGRGLQEVQVNDKFAKLSESLFLAERTARKEIEARSNLHRRLARQQNEIKEQKLRELAARARQQGSAQARVAEEEERETEEDVEARAQREELRKDRQRDMRREMRMEHMGEELKKGRAAGRDAERDVSEKIALGQAVATSKDQMFDQRLFNQDQGTGAGFRGDDEYSVYSKPLFKGSAKTYIYRNKGGDEEMSESQVQDLIEKSTSKFKPDRGFEGAEASAAATHARDKPVEFERDEADPFGLNQLLSEAKTGKKALDDIGGKAAMNTATRGKNEDYSREGRSSKKMIFEEGSSSKHRRDKDDDRHGKRRRH